MKGFKIENGVLIDYIEEEGVTEVTIPDGVTSIGHNAFLGCTSLKSITIPDRVTSIVKGAFYGCTSLKSITIPDSVTSIGRNAFYYCEKLTSATIGNSVTSIGFGAFRGCTSLKSITIPDSVTSIGEWAFSGCTSLKSITIPDSVINIGGCAFLECKNLKTKKANYKAFDFQAGKLKCRGFEYREGEWPENIDDIEICERGYHFCDNLFAIFDYYSGEIDGDIVIYECEVGEKIETDGIKSVTNRIKPVKRLYREDVIRILNGGE